MKQLIFTLLTTLCLTALPSASTPVAGLDDADVKSSAAHAANIPVDTGSPEVDDKVTDAEIQDFNPQDFIDTHQDSGTRIAVLTRLIAAGLDINKRCISRLFYPSSRISEGEVTLLHWIAYSGDLNTTKFLISAGANINAQDANGETPLHWAAHGDEGKTSISLIQEGARADIQGGADQATPAAAILNGLGKLRKSPVVSALVEITTEDMQTHIQAEEALAGIRDRQSDLVIARIQAGLRYRPQYQAHPAQQLIHIQAAIPDMLPPLVQLINKLAGRRIYSLQEDPATSAANPA